MYHPCELLFNCAGRNSITDIFFLLFAWRKGRSTSVIRVQFVCTLDKEISRKWLISSLRDPAGARTQDPNIKSVVLYLLSYRVNRFAICGCKCTAFFSISKEIFQKLFPKPGRRRQIPYSRMPLPWRTIMISSSVQSTTVLATCSPAPPSMMMSTKSWYFSLISSGSVR